MLQERMVKPTESIGDLDKSVNAGLSMFKGIRKKKKKRFW